jgi:hypothetical protein
MLSPAFTAALHMGPASRFSSAGRYASRIKPRQYTAALRKKTCPVGLLSAPSAPQLARARLAWTLLWHPSLEAVLPLEGQAYCSPARKSHRAVADALRCMRTFTMYLLAAMRAASSASEEMCSFSQLQRSSGGAARQNINTYRW